MEERESFENNYWAPGGASEGRRERAGVNCLFSEGSATVGHFFTSRPPVQRPFIAHSCWQGETCKIKNAIRKHLACGGEPGPARRVRPTLIFRQIRKLKSNSFCLKAWSNSKGSVWVRHHSWRLLQTQYICYASLLLNKPTKQRTIDSTTDLIRSVVK